MAAKIAGHF